MAALLRIELLSCDSQLEIAADERRFQLVGPDHLSLELAKPGDTLTLTLTVAPPPERHRNVADLADPTQEMEPKPPCHDAGVYRIDSYGCERLDYRRGRIPKSR